MTPQEAVTAYFQTMKSETDQSALMYSQYVLVMALDEMIDRWEDMGAEARDEAGARVQAWLQDFEERFSTMDVEGLCAHKFEFSAEVRQMAQNGLSEDKVLPDYEGDNFQRVAQARAILADGIYASVRGAVEHVKDRGCPYALHATSFEIVRSLAKLDLGRFGQDNCPGQIRLLETLAALRDPEPTVN